MNTSDFFGSGFRSRESGVATSSKAPEERTRFYGF